MSDTAPTLPELLVSAYGAMHRLEGDAGITWEQLVVTIAASGFTRAELEAKANDIATYEIRCTVSATQRKAITAALELMPPV